MAFNNFPYSNAHELNLDWVIKTCKEAANTALQAFAKSEDTEAFVNEYFDNLDVQQEINNKLNNMAASGELANIVDDFIPSVVTVWLNTHITQETGYVIDDTLTVAGAAADAAAVGRVKSNLLYRAVEKLDTTCFEKGSLANGNDDTFRANQRARTPLMMAVNDIEINVKLAQYPDAVVAVSIFSSDGTFQSSSAWVYDYTIKKGTIFRALIDFNAPSTISGNKTVSEICATCVFSKKNVNFKTFTETDNLQLLFEHGSLAYGENDDNTSFKARARMIDKLVCDKDILVKWKTGYYTLVFFDSNLTFAEGWGWLQKDHFIPAGTIFRIVVTLDNTSTAPQTIPTLVNCIDFEVIDDKQLNNDRCITWQCRNVDDTFYPPYSKWYIKAAAENQYDRVRVNVRKTTDDYYVLIHDNTINNVAVNPDGTAIESAFNSYGHTLAEFNAFDWGLKYSKQYAGATVPTLTEACKYAAMYNLSLTLELSLTPTSTDITNICKVLEQYGLADNCIVIYGALFDHTYYLTLKEFVTKNPFISVCVGGGLSVLTQNATDIADLETGKNSIYAVGIDTWGSEEVTEATRTYICNHGWKLYNSNAMTYTQLINQVGFNHGYTLIEANNIYMIKDKIRAYANGQI